MSIRIFFCRKELLNCTLRFRVQNNANFFEATKVISCSLVTSVYVCLPACLGACERVYTYVCVRMRACFRAGANENPLANPIIPRSPRRTQTRCPGADPDINWQALATSASNAGLQAVISVTSSTGPYLAISWF